MCFSRRGYTETSRGFSTSPLVLFSAARRRTRFSHAKAKPCGGTMSTSHTDRFTDPRVHSLIESPDFELRMIVGSQHTNCPISFVKSVPSVMLARSHSFGDSFAIFVPMSSTRTAAKPEFSADWRPSAKHPTPIGRRSCTPFTDRRSCLSKVLRSGARKLVSSTSVTRSPNATPRGDAT